MTIVATPPAASDTPATELLITDFTDDSANLGWYVVNDNVMGGRSEGSFSLDQGTLVFSGRLNTNGGGFSSIRTRAVTTELSDYDGIRLQVLGDGRRYTWQLASASRWRGRQISYWADFQTQDGIWQRVDIPFADFVAKFRGNRIDAPPLDPSQVQGMGLMISDGRDGPFKLQLASVHVFTNASAFTLDEYRWKRRVLVVSADDVNDPRVEAQLDAIASSADGFADRDMVLVTLLDAGGSKAGDRQLTNAEATSIREELDVRTGDFEVRLIGKDGSVKLTESEATPMPEIYALIDTMPMRRAEREKAE